MARRYYRGAARTRARNGRVSLHLIVSAELAGKVRTIAAQQGMTTSAITRALLVVATDPSLVHVEVGLWERIARLLAGARDTPDDKAIDYVRDAQAVAVAVERGGVYPAVGQKKPAIVQLDLPGVK